MNHPKVTIIILNWNGKEDTIECLESLKHITYPNYEILLVDNGSTDGSEEYFRERYPGIEIIETGNNLGFAGGNNMGIRRAMDDGADYVLLLNNDTIVEPSFLSELINVGEKEELIGILGPRIFWHSTNKIHMEKRYKNVKKPLESYISGCCFLIKRKIINEIGLLDDTFFLFFEETDYFERTFRKGYSVVFVPTEGKVYHKFSPSVAKLKSYALYNVSRSGVIFFRKHNNLKFLNYFMSMFIYSIIFKANLKGLYHFLNGLKDGLKVNLRAKY